jgi:hypothetical protein
MAIVVILALAIVPQFGKYMERGMRHERTRLRLVHREDR